MPARSAAAAAAVVAAMLASSATAFAPAPGPRTRHGARTLAATAAAFDLKEFLEVKRVAVEGALDDSITPVTQDDPTARIVDSMRYSLLAGGKRIRPVLCIAACEMLGGTQEQAMPAAVALEMIHTMSLIHDDLPAMDNDDLRRGKPTNHVLYGEDLAILAGDSLLSTAFEHCAEASLKAGVPAERVVEVIRRLGESVGAVGLAGGQAMDLASEGNPDVTLDQLQWIHKHKTGALLRAAVTCGAVLAGASKAEVDACETYATDIGLAFQVADDILDITATSEDLGKTAGKDLEADKATYPKFLGLDGAKKEAKRLVEDAVVALEPFGEGAAPLRGIATYIIERKN